MNKTLNTNGRNYGNSCIFWLHNCTSVYSFDFILKNVILLLIYFTINRENENKFYCQVCVHIREICYSDRNMNAGYTFTFMHLADAFIQSDLQYIQVMRVPWELNPQTFVLLTQCSTTEPQEHSQQVDINA